MNTVGFRLRKIRKNKGLTMKSLADAASRLSGTNMTQSAISEVEREVSKNFRTENLHAICEVLDLHPKWLSTGQGTISPYHQLVGERIAIARKRKDWTVSELSKELELWTIKPAINIAGIQAIEAGKRMLIEPELEVYAGVLQVSESWLEGKETNDMIDLPNLAVVKETGEVTIPQLSAVASMGKGTPADLEHDTVVSKVSVNQRWIQENLSTISSPANLAMITGHGDSMEGTFNNGDVLFVDTGINEIKVDAVYVFNLNDELYIKRLQRNPDGSVLMISDNTRYQPLTITDKEKLTILGRIVGIWNFKRM